jgi:hypothetical protein
VPDTISSDATAVSAFSGQLCTISVGVRSVFSADGGRVERVYACSSPCQAVAFVNPDGKFDAQVDDPATTMQSENDTEQPIIDSRPQVVWTLSAQAQTAGQSTTNTFTLCVKAPSTQDRHNIRLLFAVYLIDSIG